MPFGFPDGAMFPLFGMTIPFGEEPNGMVAALPFALGLDAPAPIEPPVLGAAPSPTPPAALHSEMTPTTNIEATMNVFIVASCRGLLVGRRRHCRGHASFITITRNRRAI